MVRPTSHDRRPNELTEKACGSVQPSNTGRPMYCTLRAAGDTPVFCTPYGSFDDPQGTPADADAIRAALAADAPCPLSTPGLVIETVAPESAAFRAGLMPGDRLFSWCRTQNGAEGCAARGDLRTPFDWLDLQTEDVQRGGVLVEGTRGSENHRWSLLPTSQGLTLAPLLQGELDRIYKSARDHENAGDPASAAQDLERAEQLAEGNHCADAAVWLRMRAAQLHDKARQPPEADAGFQRLSRISGRIFTPISPRI